MINLLHHSTLTTNQREEIPQQQQTQPTSGRTFFSAAVRPQRSGITVSTSSLTLLSRLGIDRNCCNLVHIIAPLIDRNGEGSIASS